MWCLAFFLGVYAVKAIQVSNKYTEKYGPIGELYPWLDEDSVILDAMMPWQAEAQDQGEWILKKNNETLSLGYDVRIDGPGLEAGRYQLTHNNTIKKLYSLYIRRELRELLPEDRIRLLAAMKIIYQTSTKTGKEIYGATFFGLDALVTLHHVGSSQRDADHMHQGVGFLAQHAKLTELFELSLRAVDPTVCGLPYWDSTIEEAQRDLGLIDSVFETELWSAKWFGSIGAFVTDDQESNIEYTNMSWAIQDGVFAYLRALRLEDAYGPSSDWLPHNAYGFLRAPWNNNRSPYVTRYPRPEARLPSCQDHYQYAESDIDIRGGNSWINGHFDKATWMYDVSTKAHGRLHSSPGGQLSIGLINKIAEELFTRFNISQVKQHTLWRARVIDFPDDCTQIDMQDCAPYCALDTYAHNLTAIGYEIVKAQVSLPSANTLADWQSRSHDLQAIATAYCFGKEHSLSSNSIPPTEHRSGPDVFISGDAKDSGGSVSPDFWPIHPTLTRLLQYRILFGPAFQDETWPINESCFGSRSADIDPDRLAFSIDDVHTTSKNDVATSPFFSPPSLIPCDFESCCGGHLEDSQLYARYPDIKFGPTNADTIRLLDPRQPPDPHYPTVYHHFRFTHCQQVGVFFKADKLYTYSSSFSAASSAIL